MKQKTTLIVAGAFLLLGAGAIALMNFQSSAPKGAEIKDGVSTKSGSATLSGDLSSTENPRTTPRVERKFRDSDLVEKYGESRTNLSRHVVDNVVSLLDDAVGMGEMMTSGKGNPFGGGDWAIRGMLRNTNVELNEEQKTKAAALFADYQKRELQRSKDALVNLKSNPSSLMSLLLASDARSRDQISEADYAALQTSSANDLKGIINPLDQANFRPRDPLRDDSFRSGFEAILDADQATAFNTSVAERKAAEAEKPQSTAEAGNIANIPVMDLESLDKAVGSAKQMTSGFKQVMEGMGNLKDLGPLMERQRKPETGE